MRKSPERLYPDINTLSMATLSSVTPLGCYSQGGCHSPQAPPQWWLPLTSGNTTSSAATHLTQHHQVGCHSPQAPTPGPLPLTSGTTTRSAATHLRHHYQFGCHSPQVPPPVRLPLTSGTTTRSAATHLRSHRQEVVKSVVSEATLAQVKDAHSQLEVPGQRCDERTLATARRTVQQVAPPIWDA